MLVLTQLPVHGSYAGDLLVGLLPMSIGMGLTFVPITLLGTSGVRGEDAGLASGLFNTAQQVGGSLGLAILSSLAASQTSSVLHGTGAAAAAGGAGVGLSRRLPGRRDHARRRGRAADVRAAARGTCGTSSWRSPRPAMVPVAAV